MNGNQQTQYVNFERKYISIAQFVVIFTVLVVSLFNLTTQIGDANLWTNLLVGALGFLIPSPLSLKGKNSENSN